MAKEKLSEFERYKRKLNIRKKLSAIFWLLLITAVAAGGVVWFGAFSKSEFGVAFRSQFTRDEQFPIALSGGSIRQIEPLEWDICFINDTDFYVYDNKGNICLLYTSRGHRRGIVHLGGRVRALPHADRLSGAHPARALRHPEGL